MGMINSRHLLVHKPSETSLLVSEIGFYLMGKERAKKVAGPSTLVGAVLMSKGNLHMRCVLGCSKANGLLYPPTKS